MEKLIIFVTTLLACSLQGVVVGDSDWYVSFSSARFGPNRDTDVGYNGWVPVSEDGGGMIFNGSAIGSTSIANVNYDGGAGTSLRTFKKDNPFGPNPSAAWIIEEQFTTTEQSAVGPLTTYDAAGAVNVSFYYMIKTGTAIDPRDGTTILNLVAPTAFVYGLKFFDSVGDGIEGSPTKNAGNRWITEEKNVSGLVADDSWHQVSFTLNLLTPAEREALDYLGDDDSSQPTLHEFDIIGDALSPYDVYIDRVEITAVPSVIAPAGVAVVIAGADVQLTFDSVNGQSYQLLVSTDDMASFGPVAGATDTGDGNPLTLTDIGGAPASGSKVFYRIETN